MLLIILLLLAGILGGTLAGLLGVGGGVIYTPILFFLYDDALTNPVPWTVASGLFCTFAASAGSTRKHFAMGNWFLKESLKVGLFGVLGTTIGKYITLSPVYSREHFVILFSLILFYTAFNFFRGKKKKDPITQQTQTENLPLKWHHAFFAGGLGGIVATLAGVGGGIVMVPILTLILGQSFLKSISISSAAIFLISLSATVQFMFESPAEAGITGFTVGYVDFGTTLPLIIGAVLGANTGALIANKINHRKLELVFATLALLVGLRLIYDISGL